MKTILLLSLFYIFAFANETIYFQKGWSLVGVPSHLESLELFENEKVEIIWSYDTQKQSWQGFSPDVTMQEKISAKNLDTLHSLKPWQGFWILSKENWALDIPTNIPESPSNNMIYLHEGWNLLTLPQNIIINTTLFEDDLVWKYTDSQEWQINDSDLSFPTLHEIEQNEGFWVKSESDRVIDLSDALSKLHTFNTQEDMLSYIRQMLKVNSYNSYDYGILEVPTTADTVNSDDMATESGSSTDASQTNLQESGVDESDILKHDATYIYSIDSQNEQIFISSFENIAAEIYTAINTISTVGKTVHSMYLQNNRLILLSNEYKNYIYTDTDIELTSMPYYPTSSQVAIEIYDVSDINNITSLSTYSLDGNFQESRLLDNKLLLISSFYPEINYEYDKIYPTTPCNNLDTPLFYTGYDIVSSDSSSDSSIKKEYTDWDDNNCYQYNYDDNGAFTYDYGNPTVISEKLTPTLSNDGKNISLVSPSKFYAPLKLNQSAAITTLTQFDINTSTFSDAISFLGNTHTYYASTEALYLGSNEYPLYYDYANYKEQQMIYKFSISDTLAYKGRGIIPGSMLNQFSMSEYNNYLRVATTAGFSWSSEDTNNSVFSMQENNESLDIVGTLSGLGKECETIKAVRFMQERAYVVTFRQTDPLYTLDMSDPTKPTKVGELSIPGFSTYLHVVDDNRILSIGRDADEDGRSLGLQLQLFDISDFSNPLLADKIQIGDVYTYSSAEYNHKAFSYRSSDMMFGLPYTYNPPQNYTNNFAIYQINNMSINSIDTLTNNTNDYNYWNNTRGIIFDINTTSYGAMFEGSNIVSKIIQGE
ncbi:MAG: beta-propeller domain-containing protein [Campylobacterota bacterium]|nr:beta-propeller domain-containing protein [Campylobacterota bacterium]